MNGKYTHIPDLPVYLKTSICFCKEPLQPLLGYTGYFSSEYAPRRAFSIADSLKSDAKICIFFHDFRQYGSLKVL
jgi:hypothetical protein